MRVRPMVEVTLAGHWQALGFAIRRLFVRPATENRCFMGAPVRDEVWCPRSAVEGSLWCRRHHPADPIGEES